MACTTPTACSLFEGVSHLMPGTYQVLDLSTGELSAPTAWWSPKLEETAHLSFTAAAGGCASCSSKA